MDNQNIERTSDEWDQFEQNKRSKLEELNAQKTIVKAKRADLFLEFGDSPNNKDLKKSINDIEKNLQDLEIEIESAKALLDAIPKRRKNARAGEIEVEIKEIQALDDRIKEQAGRIDQAAEAFAKEVQQYFDILEDLHERSPYGFPRGLGIAISVLNAVGFYLRKYSLWGWVTVGDFRGATSMVEGLEANHARRAIRVLLNGMSESAARLRGEKTEGEERCSVCFGNIGMDRTTGNKSCQRCGAII